MLNDAKAIVASSLEHDFAKDGPHIITGPVEIAGAKAGDVLMVAMLALEPRVPYGVISNRHGKGALTQEEFSRELGRSRATLTRLESASENTTINTLDQISKALRCDVRDLFRANPR